MQRVWKVLLQEVGLGDAQEDSPHGIRGPVIANKGLGLFNKTFSRSIEVEWGSTIVVIIPSTEELTG